MTVNSTSMTSALASVDYVSLFRASTQGQTGGSSGTIPQEILNLCQPSTVSLDAQSNTTTSDAVLQVSRPSDVSLDADSLQQLSNYMTNKSSLDATTEAQSLNSRLMKFFGG
jgi:hypothetical protein